MGVEKISHALAFQLVIQILSVSLKKKIDRYLVSATNDVEIMSACR